ncbi:MAG: hypothetical protein GXO55_01755 [Chloroflexi bacterium]|nr:hypothetical protein [Chloroflexota bacterium]
MSALKRPYWKIRQYVRLRNVSEHNILLHLPTGEQRLDRGRALLIPQYALDDPEIRSYLDKQWVTVEK